MKRILSILLIFAINMSFVTVRAEGVESEPDNTFEELPVQEEYFYEPIEHSETIPYAMELTDEEDFGERGISAFSLSTTERDVWKRALANEFGSDFLEPYMQKKEGYSISGNSNRLTIRETDLYLEGKNGLDLSIRRKYDNQYNKRFYTYYKGSETSVTHTREVYSFKIQETGESINIGFFSTDDLYTYLYDGAYLSRLPSKTYTEKDVTSEEGSNVTYYRFENVYTYFTTEDKAEITLEYDSETASKKVREKVSYSDYYLAQKKSLNNSVSFGNGWILDLPESYINLTYLDTYRDGNYIEQDFDCVGTFNDINGNIYYFEGTGRLKSNADTDTTTYSSSFWCDDNNYLSMKSFVRPQLLYENGPEYNFIVYDSCGLTYYFYNSGIKQSGLSRSQPMVIVAVSDRYGNMIRYERDGNSLIVNKIIDTYGREVNISPSGISYYDKEKDELKTISYNSSQLPASALENDSYLSEKPVLRLTVTNEIGEQTIYDAREVEIMCHYESTSTSRDITEITDPQDQRYEFINNYNIERITYPDNSQVNFKYKPYYIQNGHIRMGTYAVEESYLKKDSQIKTGKHTAFQATQYRRKLKKQICQEVPKLLIHILTDCWKQAQRMRNMAWDRYIFREDMTDIII